MSSEKFNTSWQHGVNSASKSCKKPSVTRLIMSTSKLNRPSFVNKTTSSCKNSGAVDEEHFMKAFSDVHSTSISSDTINSVFEKIRNNISKKDNWEKRVEAMKNLRAVIVAYSDKCDSILHQINLLDTPLESALKDLKSQVIREACITVAFLSIKLQNKFSHFAEVVFTTLMSLIQSTVKVISSSSAVCIRFIIRNTHNSRLVPVLIHHVNSKSASVRCAACEFIDLILHQWKTKSLERHLAILKDGIRMGISDASPDARAFSRQAFWGFVDHFPEQEKTLLNSLGASYKRFLFSGMIRSNSALNNSVSRVDHVRPASSEACAAMLPNCEIYKLNESNIVNIDSSKLGNTAKHCMYSNVTKEKHQENKLCQTPLPDQVNTKYMSQRVNSNSADTNEELAFSNSNILSRPEIRHQDIEISSNNSSQSIIKTQQFYKPCKEICRMHTHGNEMSHQYQFDCGKKVSVNETVRKIVMNLSSTSLKKKVEGLVDLQLFFQAGNILDLDDLKSVTDELTKILQKDSTDFFGLLLDTLDELIVHHKKDLNYWLDSLLTQLLSKFSINILKQFENRLAGVLDVIKESFPVELQLLSLFRFFKENAQTGNVEAIAVALNYIYILIFVTGLGSDFPTTDLKNESNIITPVLTKMIEFAVNKNNSTNYSELQPTAKEAVLKLYNLNIPQIMVSFSQIPEEYQTVTQNIINGKINNTVTNSSPPPLNLLLNTDQFCDSKATKPYEVQKQLVLNTRAIQDFDCNLCKQEKMNNITSVESGTDKVSTKKKSLHNVLKIPVKSEFGVCNERQCSLFNTKINSVLHYCNPGAMNNHCTSSNATLFTLDDATIHESELVSTVLKSLNVKTENKTDKCLSLPEKITALNHLMQLTTESSSFALGKNFKLLLRTLFDYMCATDTACQILALQILTEMLNRKDITEKFNNYTELLIFQLLLLCSDKNKHVSENAVFCVNTIAIVLDPDTVIRISVPLALTSQFPTNIAAINMITMLIKNRGRDPIEMYIPDLMPNLIHSLDSMEISLRKSALFCMVALYLAVGKEPLRCYLTTLDPSKLKLLMLYVQKAKKEQQCLKD